MPHASAGVDKHPDTDRHTEIVRKEGNFLFFAILEDLKIVKLEAVHVLSLLVEDGRRYVDQLNIDVQPISWVLRIGAEWRRSCRRARRAGASVLCVQSELLRHTRHKEDQTAGSKRVFRVHAQPFTGGFVAALFFYCVGGAASIYTCRAR